MRPFGPRHGDFNGKSHLGFAISQVTHGARRLIARIAAKRIARSNSRFGIARENTGVRVVTLVLIGVVAMLFTALRCGSTATA